MNLNIAMTSEVSQAFSLSGGRPRATMRNLGWILNIPFDAMSVSDRTPLITSYRSCRRSRRPSGKCSSLSAMMVAKVLSASPVSRCTPSRTTREPLAAAANRGDWRHSVLPRLSVLNHVNERRAVVQHAINKSQSIGMNE